MSYSPEWALGACGVLVALVCVPELAVIALAVLLLGTLAALLALAGAIVATPYLLFRSVRRRLAPPRRRQAVIEHGATRPSR